MILGCPFCGRAPEDRGRPTNEGVTLGAFIHWFVCFCGGFSASAHRTGYGATPEDAREDALKRWNTRFVCSVANETS